MKILLVEDDSALRTALEELLLREGYEVKKAANYREARAGLDGSMDLVMLDVGLPDGDGVSPAELPGSLTAFTAPKIKREPAWASDLPSSRRSSAATTAPSPLKTVLTVCV